MLATMMKALIAGLVVIAIAGFIGLFIMAGVAATHDVVRIPVPSGSHLAPLKADYADAYLAPLEYNTYRSIEGVTANAFRHGGKEIFRSENEVVYEGYRLGVRYFTSYRLDRTTSPNTLALITVVRIHEPKGKYAWRAFRPVHKRLAPYLLDRMAQAAPD